MAGNPAESHAQLVLPRQRERGNGESRATAVGPSRQFRRNEPLGPRTPICAGRNAGPSFTCSGNTTASPAVAAKAADPWQPLGPPTGRTSWPAENANPASTDPAKPPAFQNDPGNGSVAIRVNPPVTNQFVSDQQPASPAAPSAPANPFNGFTASRPTGPATIPAAAGNVGPPPGVQLRWINTRVFQLDYDTRAMGGTANVPVELWGTRDGGKSWQSFGKDPKGQSPMLVTVPEEGIYGFRMAIQNGPGMAGRPPLPGDVPGIWIGIDLTRPVGRITPAQQGVGRDGDKLFIAWEASDNRELAARPISLSYSERLGGPWTSMASGLENTRAVCLAAHRQPAAADVFAAGGPRRRRQHGRLRNAGAGDASIFPVPPRSFAICVPWAGSILSRVSRRICGEREAVGWQLWVKHHSTARY